ncbi:uncharacterized protein LOC117122069 [Anneissia japonica]|uniref:uncharacterized protein LOC117122069 n=1 Tax=Anneissia japonica TaxID=1529436 RepID=UPI001425A69F|nr:uncharacterized protein LOC117122069 [Anneissia japonica]
MRKLLDKHAPEVLRTVTFRPHTPWYSDQLRNAKCVKRCSERRWKKSGLEVDRQIFRDDCKKYRSLLNKAKTDHYKAEFHKCDSRQLFQNVATMSNGSSRTFRPVGKDSDIADKFATFFKDKINQIREYLDETIPPTMAVDICDSCENGFCNFLPLS